SVGAPFELQLACSVDSVDEQAAAAFVVAHTCNSPVFVKHTRYRPNVAQWMAIFTQSSGTRSSLVAMCAKSTCIQAVASTCLPLVAHCLICVTTPLTVLSDHTIACF